MPLSYTMVPTRPAAFFGGTFRGDDEAVTSRWYIQILRDVLLHQVCDSAFWRSNARISDARERLDSTKFLQQGWDTYGAEPPNDAARALSGNVLGILEEEVLPPAHLLPSVEGGIAISFAKGHRRAEIEVYNNGEVAIVAYSMDSEPMVWEVEPTESALRRAIDDIRLHLSA